MTKILIQGRGPGMTMVKVADCVSQSNLSLCMALLLTYRKLLVPPHVEGRHGL